MELLNQMKIEFLSKSNNEAFARVSVTVFISQLDPTLDELADIKTAVSEAVTNAIVHGYRDRLGRIEIICSLYEGKTVEIRIKDEGVGIEDIEKAKEPLYTTQPEMERSGMGFTIMESFMDGMEVISSVGHGTEVILKKTLR